MEVAVAVTVKGKPLPIWGPGRFKVQRRVSQLSQSSAVCIHNVNLEIAVATAAECDPSAIGREPRTEFIAGVVGQSRRTGSMRVHNPNVPSPGLIAVERDRAMETVPRGPCDRDHIGV